MKAMLMFLLFFHPFAYSQELSFYKEDITFTLDRKHFTVDAFYWFANQSDKNYEKIIYYPFGNSSEKEQIDSIEIVNVSLNIIPTIIDHDKNGFSFLLGIAARDTAVYHIKYIQNITCDSVKYILISTQQWNKALDHAEYKLIVDKHIILTKFSYKPDKVYDINDKKIYYWARSNFMPTSDMIFHFKY
ncbi:MAG: hypothetical protein ABR936_17360 [Bacteroidota bacterium]